MVFYPVDKNIPVYRQFGWRGHVGVDWIVPVGTPVLCMMDGQVIELAEDSKTYGRYVLIKHPTGYGSLYAHLSKFNDLKLGGVVSGGQVIGWSGGAVGSDGAGKSTGYHLHFEVRPPDCLFYNLKNIDPIEYIRLLVFTHS